MPLCFKIYTLDIFRLDEIIIWSWKFGVFAYNTLHYFLWNLRSATGIDLSKLKFGAKSGQKLCIPAFRTLSFKNSRQYTFVYWFIHFSWNGRSIWTFCIVRYVCHCVLWLNTADFSKCNRSSMHSMFHTENYCGQYILHSAYLKNSLSIVVFAISNKTPLLIPNSREKELV